MWTFFLYIFGLTYIGILKYIWYIIYTKSLFHGISSAIIYHILTFFRLVSKTIINFLWAAFIMPYQYKIFMNHCLRFIHSWNEQYMYKPILYINLEYWRNINFILTCYKFKTHITSSTGRTVFYVRLSYLATRMGYFHWYWSVIYNKIHLQVI